MRAHPARPAHGAPVATREGIGRSHGVLIKIVAIGGHWGHHWGQVLQYSISSDVLEVKPLKTLSFSRGAHGLLQSPASGIAVVCGGYDEI